MKLGITAFLAVVAAILVSIAAVVTHIIICIQAGTWGLLIAGAILPVIGVVHGAGHWFGAW